MSEFTYAHTHSSVEDDSPAMMVSRDPFVVEFLLKQLDEARGIDSPTH